MSETKRCPDCAEEVQAAALVCRYCGMRFDSPPPPQAAPLPTPPLPPPPTPQPPTRTPPTPAQRRLIIGGLVAVGLIVIAISVANSMSGDDSSSSHSSVHTVLYKVGGTSKSADLTFSNSSGNVTQQNGVDVPVKRKADGGEGILTTRSDGDSLYISAQNNGDYGTITCSIVVDGVEVQSNSSSGGYSIVTCSGNL